jgi:3-hydroxy-9,10-secoandrosta-1,3,5(10)-triene-9,17-dione monooxygenase
MTIQEAVSRTELLERASDLIPVLKSRAASVEAARQVPEQTAKDFIDSGLFRIATPERYGGHGHDIDLMFEVAMELGRGCGASGWCYSVWTIHNWMLGFWPLEAQDEYFANGPDTISSSSFAPSGQLTAVDGGYLLNGRWGFSSGCDLGSWVMLGAMSDRGPCMVLLPRSDYEIVDTWFVSGLRGSGSKDIEVSNAFVPAYRVGPTMASGAAHQAFELHGRASYRLPPMSLLSFSLCSPLVGMAQGMIDEFVSRSKARPAAAESVALQMRLAESIAEVDGARRYIRSICSELLAEADSTGAVSELQLARSRLTYGYVAKLCVQATTRLFQASGGHAIHNTEPLRRFHDDVIAASHHTALAWDPIAEAFGRVALGLPPLPQYRGR